VLTIPESVLTITGTPAHDPGISAHAGPESPLTMVRNTHPVDPDDLMANVRGFMRGKQRRPDSVRSYFRGRHVAYAAL